MCKPYISHYFIASLNLEKLSNCKAFPNKMLS